jgi:hypothetical protein
MSSTEFIPFRFLRGKKWLMSWLGAEFSHRSRVEAIQGGQGYLC